MSSPIPFIPAIAPATPCGGGCPEIDRPGTPRPPPQAPRAPSPYADSATQEKPTVERRTLKHIMKTIGGLVTDDPETALEYLDDLLLEIREIADSAPANETILDILADLHGMRLLVLLLTQKSEEELAEDDVASILEDISDGAAAAYDRLVAVVTIV